MSEIPSDLRLQTLDHILREKVHFVRVRFEKMVRSFEKIHTFFECASSRVRVVFESCSSRLRLVFGSGLSLVRDSAVTDSAQVRIRFDWAGLGGKEMGKVSRSIYDFGNRLVPVR